MSFHDEAVPVRKHLTLPLYRISEGCARPGASQTQFRITM